MSGELTIQHWAEQQAQADAKWQLELESLERRHKALEGWHAAQRALQPDDPAESDDWQPWFAWRPVMLTSGEMAWLTTVHRRWQEAFLHGWEYYRP